MLLIKYFEKSLKNICKFKFLILPLYQQNKTSLTLLNFSIMKTYNNTKDIINERIYNAYNEKAGFDEDGFFGEPSNDDIDYVVYGDALLDEDEYEMQEADYDDVRNRFYERIKEDVKDAEESEEHYRSLLNFR